MEVSPAVTLRDLLPGDWARIGAWEADEEILGYLGKKGLTAALANAAGDRRRLVAGSRRRVFAIEADGVSIGYVELREIDWRRRAAELRICIGVKEYWGRGYGTAAVRQLMAWGFEAAGLEYLYLRVYRDNRRALRCYEKCGFRYEGILRAGGRTPDAIVLMGITRPGSLAGLAAARQPSHPPNDIPPAWGSSAGPDRG